MKKCPDCHAILDDDAIYCDQCGVRVKPAPGNSIDEVVSEPVAQLGSSTSNVAEGTGQGAACPSCGYINLPGESYCSNCGYQLPVYYEETPAMRNVQESAQTDVQAVIPALAPVSSPERVSKSCPNCGFVNPVGETYCQNCGFWLTQDPYFAVPPSGASGTYYESPISISTAPSFETEAALQFSGRLFSPATNASLPLPVQPEIIIGRRDPERGIFPDIDLSGQGSASNSISRRHARLFMQAGQVFVEDLNSTNASYLNRQRLQPGQRYLLKDGDELRLGGVVLIFFAQ